MKKIILLLLLLPVLVSAQKPQLVIKNGLQSQAIMASISPDNKLGLTVDQKESLILWDLVSGRQLQTYPDIVAADFNKDNKSIEIVTNTGIFRTIDFTGQILKEFPKGNLGNGEGIGGSYYRNAGLTLKSGYIYTKEKGFLGRVYIDYFGTQQDYSDKLNLISIPFVHEVRICKIPTGEIVKTFKFNLVEKYENGDNIRFTQFSPDGRFLLAGNNSSIDIIEINSGQHIFTFNSTANNENESVNIASFSPDNSKLLMLTTHNAILIDLSSKKELWRQKQTEFGFNQYSSERGIAKFSDDGTSALIGYNKTFNFINTENGDVISKVFGLTNQVVYFQQIANLEKNLVVSMGDKIATWNLKSGSLQKLTEIGNSDKLQINASAGKFYSFWAETDANTSVKKDFLSTERGGGGGYSLSLSFNDKLLLHTGTYENKALNNPNGINHEKLIVADVATKKTIWRKNEINIARFAHKSTTIAAINTYSSFNTIQLLDGLTGKLLRLLTLPKKLNGAFELNFSPNDNYLTFATGSSQVIYGLETGKFIEIDQQTPNGKKIYAAQFLPNETSMIISDYDGTLFFYDIAAQNWVTNKSIKVSENAVPAMSVTKNNRYLFTNGKESNVKLWDLQTMELLATLYPNPATGDWAVVTPNGQFDASLGAQKDIYFVKGINTYPLTALYEKYFTPNLLPRLLAGERFEPVGFNELFKAPSVKISYEQKSRNLTVENDQPTYQNTTGLAEITVTATATEGKVDEIRLFHNGKTLTLTTRNLIIADDNEQTTVVKKYSVNLLPGQNSIRAIALNAQRTESQPDEISVIYKNSNIATPVQPPANVGQSIISSIDKDATLHLVVVGINAYSNPAMSLNYALADATAFKNEIEKDAKSVISNTKTYFVTDKEADKNGITNALKEVQKTAKPQDVFVFYYAGHGIISKDKEFYLVPADVSDLKNVQSELEQKGLNSKLLQQYAVDITAQKQLFILDACQSAGAFESMLSTSSEQQKNISLAARSTGTHWMAASGAMQFANEFSSLGHGVFTYVLLQALKGEASQNKMITVNGLKNFLQLKVPELMKKYNGAEQYPASYGFGNDFPVEIIK